MGYSTPYDVTMLSNKKLGEEEGRGGRTFKVMAFVFLTNSYL